MWTYLFGSYNGFITINSWINARKIADCWKMRVVVLKTLSRNGSRTDKWNQEELITKSRKEQGGSRSPRDLGSRSSGPLFYCPTRHSSSSLWWLLFLCTHHSLVQRPPFVQSLVSFMRETHDRTSWPSWELCGEGGGQASEWCLLCWGCASNSEMIPTSRILQSSSERPVHGKLSIGCNYYDGNIHQVVVRDSSLFWEKTPKLCLEQWARFTRYT